MPELPEVETVRRGLAPALTNRVIREVMIRRRRLREAIPADFSRRVTGKKVQAVERRGKYLLLRLGTETCIIHLGMSGVLSLSALPPHHKHAHVGMLLDDERYLIYTDPRRFGLMTVTARPPAAHRLLAALGPEPLTAAFNHSYFRRRLAGKKMPIKTALMDSHLVAGVGNIYASESLHQAGVHPGTLAGRLSADDCRRLTAAIKTVLRQALRAGGSSMRDFIAADGSPGYFQTRWLVYDRAGQPCLNQCGAQVVQLRQSGRSSYYCPNCQPSPEMTGRG